MDDLTIYLSSYRPKYLSIQLEWPAESSTLSLELLEDFQLTKSVTYTLLGLLLKQKDPHCPFFTITKDEFRNKAGNWVISSDNDDFVKPVTFEEVTSMDFEKNQVCQMLFMREERSIGTRSKGSMNRSFHEIQKYLEESKPPVSFKKTPQTDLISPVARTPEFQQDFYYPNLENGQGRVSS